MTTSIPQSETDRPPYTNKGGSQQDLFSEICIDWLTSTMQYGDHERNIELLKVVFDEQDTSKGKPSKGYTDAIKLGDVGTLSWHPGNPRMGYSFNMTGQGMNASRFRGVRDDQLIARLNPIKKRFTRIDIAVDFRNGDVEIDDIARAITSGDCVTRHTQFQDFVTRNFDGSRDRTKGRTIYIGSRKNERFVRIYDKAAEQEIEGEKWVRCELVARKPYADVLSASISDYGIVEAGKAAVKKLVNFPSIKWWVTGLENTRQVHIEKLARKDTDALNWLVEIVLPILKRELSDMDSGAERLDTIYQDAINEMRYKRRATLK